MKIKRDEHNQLIPEDADRVIKKVTEDLITTHRDYQKDITFKHSLSRHRDVIVKFLIYQRNTVDGKIVQEHYQDPQFEKLSDDPLDPFRYKLYDYVDGEIFVKDIPMPMHKVGKWTMGCFKAVVNYLCRMGVFNNV